MGILKTDKVTVRKTCAVNSKIGSVKEFMKILDMRDAIDRLAMVNSVLRLTCVEEGRQSCLQNSISARS